MSRCDLLPYSCKDSSLGYQSLISKGPSRLFYFLYSLALVVSVSVWLIAIRSPLWQDETGSYWQISAGFSGILSRQPLSFPAYSYVLWLTTKLIGSNEIALRVPSILAMLGAIYLLYQATRKTFDSETGIIAVIIFSTCPGIIFEAIDVRPYPFALLAICAALFVLVCLRDDDSNKTAFLFGVVAACIVWFQYLFIVILPALVLCFIVNKRCDRRAFFRQSCVALLGFVLAFIPEIPGMLDMARHGQTHVFELAPNLKYLYSVLAPGFLTLIYAFFAVIAIAVPTFVKQRKTPSVHFECWKALVCASLALFPVLTLYGISVVTPIHCFSARHCIVAVPGIALCWAYAVRFFRFLTVRLLFCMVLVASTSCVYFYFPPARHHLFSWKSALGVVQNNASVDNAPVFICSDFVESDFAPMPLGSAKDSFFFTPLSYYKLSVPVIPLPMDLNDETIRVGSRFLQQASAKHERFFAVALLPSRPTLDWLAQRASADYRVRELGVFETVMVREFDPKETATER